MKKKIKDVTIGELNAACRKYDCEDCPLTRACDIALCEDRKEAEEEEIEIPEEELQ